LRNTWFLRGPQPRRRARERLVFTDADCRPSSGWLQAFAARARDAANKSDLLAGAVEIVPGGEKPNPYEIFDMIKGIPQERYVRRGYAATANLAVAQAVFEALGGFDDARLSGGDAEFCRRAVEAGHSIEFVPQAVVDHPARSTWHEIATKARRVRGAQLTSGPKGRRRLWMLATLAPPLRLSGRLLGAGQHPLSHRLVAMGILFRIWGVQVRELAHLSRGGKAERR
jgi:GT2 family glycosyltransferase